MYFIYILECTNNSYYTGYTTDIYRRYQEHVKGTVKCKYTRSFPPLRLAACWKMSLTLSDILRLEKVIKKLSRAQKIALIQVPSILHAILYENGYDKECATYIEPL